MQHNIENYTDRDLKAAIASPYQPKEFKLQCEAELTSRIHNNNKHFEYIRVHNLT
jgi:hypothetical protein